MKITLFYFLVSISLSITAQNPFENGMRKAFEYWEADEIDQAANMFERIAQVERDSWLPSFYVAQINLLKSFSEKDINILTTQLQKAQEYIEMAKSIAIDNPEIMVLEAQMFTAWIVFDGQKYGMKYSGKINELYQKAAQLAPNNPRVVLSKAEWEMGTAKWFGKSTEPYCQDLERAAALFATFTPESEFHPKGGAKRVAQIIEQNNCNK